MMKITEDVEVACDRGLFGCVIIVERMVVESSCCREKCLEDTTAIANTTTGNIWGFRVEGRVTAHIYFSYIEQSIVSKRFMCRNKNNTASV